MEQRVSQLPDIAAIRGAPATDRQNRATKRLRLAAHADGPSNGSAFAAAKRQIRRSREPTAFPNVAALLYSVSEPISDLTPDLARPLLADHGQAGRARKPMTRPCSSVPCVASVSPMSLDIAEIANTVNAAPVTVLDVVATTDERRRSAEEDRPSFAEQLSVRCPTRRPWSRRRVSVRQIRAITPRNDIRIMGNDDPAREGPHGRAAERCAHLCGSGPAD